MMTTTAFQRFAVAAATAALLAGCSSGGQQITKSGATSVRTTTLTLQQVDTVDPDRDLLVKEVETASRGALKFAVSRSDTYDSTDPAKEARLVGDLRSGAVDFGYVPARDLATAGSIEFQALGSPFAITTFAAVQQFTSGPAGDTALKNLRTLGLVGIGLVPSELRTFTSKDPLVTVSDFAGRRIRIIDNPQTAAMVSGLGATPVQKLQASQVITELKAGRLDGVESSPTFVRSNGYQTSMPYTTTYAAFPKVNVLVASNAAWSRLSTEQQGWLRLAAVRAQAAAVGQVPLRQGEVLSAMCKAGAILVRPPAKAFAEIVATAQAAATPAVRDAVGRLRKGVAAAGAVDQTGPLPPECTVAGSVAEATAAHAKVAAPAFVHQGGTQIPEGTYRVTTTVADLQAGGQYGPDWNKDITWTAVLKNDTIRMSQVPDYPDQGPCEGTYAVRGDQVSFTWTGDCAHLGTESVRWSFYQGKLSLAVVDVADTAGRVIYSAHPWQKVG
jgi:TRAP-type C4-dicarboxylate transport system substrate-binding protein